MVVEGDTMTQWRDGDGAVEHTGRVTTTVVASLFFLYRN
jgi:hypothetical protein